VAVVMAAALAVMAVALAAAALLASAAAVGGFALARLAVPVTAVVVMSLLGFDAFHSSSAAAPGDVQQFLRMLAHQLLQKGLDQACLACLAAADSQMYHLPQVLQHQVFHHQPEEPPEPPLHLHGVCWASEKTLVGQPQ